MIAQQVAKKYAKALFLSVKERGLVDEAHEQFIAFQTIIDQNKSLLTLLSGPQISDSEKIDLIGRLFQDRMNRLHVEFLNVLIRKRRVVYLPEIVAELSELIEDEKGIARATVVSPVALTPDEEANIVNKMQSYTGKTVIVEKAVDPSIIGGMIVKLKNEVIDGSLRYGLNQLQEKLSRLRVH